MPLRLAQSFTSRVKSLARRRGLVGAEGKTLAPNLFGSLLVHALLHAGLEDPLQQDFAQLYEAVLLTFIPGLAAKKCTRPPELKPRWRWRAFVVGFVAVVVVAVVVAAFADYDCGWRVDSCVVIVSD